MKDEILKRIAILNASLLLITIAPKISFAEMTPLSKKISITVLAGGNSYSLDNRGQIVFPAQEFRTDSFEVQGNNSHFASGVGMAYEKILDSNTYRLGNIFQSISIGANAYYNDKSKHHGSVYEYSLADFNNATYTMNIKSFRLMLDTEWTLHPLHFGIMPFVEAGVGAAQNTMNFQNIPRPNIGADGGNYTLSDNAQTQFAYELGAGLKIPLSNHFIASARYLFVDKGNAESEIFDTKTGVFLANSIKTKVQSQSVLFGLSYLFG